MIPAPTLADLVLQYQALRDRNESFPAARARKAMVDLATAEKARREPLTQWTDHGPQPLNERGV